MPPTSKVSPDASTTAPCSARCPERLMRGDGGAGKLLGRKSEHRDRRTLAADVETELELFDAARREIADERVRHLRAVEQLAARDEEVIAEDAERRVVPSLDVGREAT